MKLLIQSLKKYSLHSLDESFVQTPVLLQDVPPVYATRQHTSDAHGIAIPACCSLAVSRRAPRRDRMEAFDEIRLDPSGMSSLHSLSHAISKEGFASFVKVSHEAPQTNKKMNGLSATTQNFDANQL